MDKFCQSCGMPMPSEDLLGTNADGTKSQDYCVYCYEEGEFLEDYTMEEMIDYCAEFVDDFNKNLEQPITREEAIELMQEQFPTLKRWRK